MAKTPPVRKVQQEEGPRQSNKQASAKLERNLSRKGKASPVRKGKRIMKGSSSMSSSAFVASPPKEKGAWGSIDPEAKPKWGILKSFEAHQDELRWDSEWGGTQERRDRDDRDKRIERGGSPAPKEKQGASSWTSSRTREGQLWGKVKGEETMNFDAQRSESDEGHSCEEGPDCRFRSLGEGGKKRVGKKVKPPKKKKAKKAALPPIKSLAPIYL